MVKPWLTSLADLMLGPRCPFCTHRGRGYRSLDRHILRTHGRTL